MGLHNTLGDKNMNRLHCVLCIQHLLRTDLGDTHSGVHQVLERLKCGEGAVIILFDVKVDPKVKFMQSHAQKNTKYLQAKR